MLTGAVTRQKSVIHAEVMGMFTSHTGERLVLKCLDIIRHAAAELVIHQYTIYPSKAKPCSTLITILVSQTCLDTCLLFLVCVCVLV